MYKLYRNECLNCPFCQKIVNLYYAKSHIKGKQCKALQKLHEQDQYNKLYLEFAQDINKIKSEIVIKKEDEKLS